MLIVNIILIDIISLKQQYNLHLVINLYLYQIIFEISHLYCCCQCPRQTQRKKTAHRKRKKRSKRKHKRH